MQPQDWAGLILTTLSIVALVVGGVKFLVKHYFEEIRSEIRPNSGTSLKDQVTRLESQHMIFQERIDEADTMRREMNSKLDKMYLILLDHIAKNNK
jgi:hypothetical protein